MTGFTDMFSELNTTFKSVFKVVVSAGQYKYLITMKLA